MNFGVTAAGFVRKRLPEVFDSLRQKLRLVHGENINLDPQTPDGQQLGLLSDSIAEGWEVLETVFQNLDPSNSDIVNLRRRAKMTGQLPQGDTESDVEFAKRITQNSSSINLADGLSDRLNRLAGVDNAFVYINADTDVDAKGFPAKAYSAIVAGGDENEIARAIWTSYPSGTTLVGNTRVCIEDSTGRPRWINFTRPAVLEPEITIYIRTYEANCSCGVPNATDLAAQLVESLYSDGCGLRPSDNLPVSKISGILNSIEGVEVLAVFINGVRDADLEVNWDNFVNVLAENVTILFNVEVP